MYSMYFDGANMHDWASMKGKGQVAVSTLMDMLGASFAPGKKQAMANEGTFLGLDHDVTKVLEKKQVRFWVKQGLEDKVMSFVTRCEISNYLPPGTASKLYGLTNFLET